MKKLILYFVFLAVLWVFLGNCATNKMEYISKDYELYGTWVNPDYEDKRRPAVVIFYPNNFSESFPTLKKDKSGGSYWYDITNKWVDRDGNVWFTVIYIMYDKSWLYQLFKMSNDGKTLESMWDSDDYPKEINPESINANYEIFYRE